MVLLDWPNAISPGLAPFRIDAPEGWTATEAPGTVLVLLAPERDGFRANLVITGERLDVATSADRVAERALRDHTGVAEGDATDRPAGERELAVAVRRGSMEVEGRLVQQLVVATEAEDRSPGGLRSVFTLIGTFLGEHAGEDEPRLKHVIESFAVFPD